MGRRSWANPGTNTWSNSSPLATWIVITFTESASEGCTGDPARRTGNEYLFDAQAKANVTTLNDFGVKKIVTACPHCLNSLKNEYPAFGGKYEVLHHTQLIDDLVQNKRIELDAAMPKARKGPLLHP